MIPMTLDEIAAVVGGSVDGDGSTRVTGPAYVDSRQPVVGGLFVAVAGERVDGHDFADDAHAVLGSRSTGRPTVVADDPVLALGRLARHVLDHTGAAVLALTGSQGKTGTKDYLAHVLATAAGTGVPRSTVATQGNHNNELGVPLTVLRATGETTHLVVEMGARGIGHVQYLCRVAPPVVAAVLNVGTAHLAEFGSREAIAQAKGEIVEALPEAGTAVLNADDDLVAAMTDRTVGRVLTFGEAAGPAGVTWRGLQLDDLGRPSFELGHAGEWHAVTLRQPGAHQVANAAAAVAMAAAVGVDLADAVAALASAEPASRWRMELHERADGLVVLNDAYNANPASMRAAVEALAALGRGRDGGRRRTIAVLGEMKELGPTAHQDHVAVGRAAAEAGTDVVLVVGGAAAGIAEGARSSDGWHGEAILTAGRDDALAWVRENAGAGDAVLVKASRGAALEVVAEGLLEDVT